MVEWIGKNPTAILRYEDLRAMPKDTLGSLFMRLEVEVTPEIIQEAVAQLPGDNFFPLEKDIFNDWESYFTSRGKTELSQKAGEVLTSLGYVSSG